MISLFEIARSMTAITVGGAVLLWSVLLVRAFLAWRGRTARLPWRAVSDRGSLKVLKLTWVLALSTFAVGVAYFLLVPAGFRRFMPESGLWTCVAGLFMLAVVEWSLLRTLSPALVKRPWKMLVLAALVLPVGGLGALLCSGIAEQLAYPAAKDCLLLDAPVRGEWALVHAGASRRVNHHDDHLAQQYAMDLVALDADGHFYVGTGSELEKHAAWGRTVYAPVEGIVVAAVDGLPDGPVTLAPSEHTNPAGNHVAIRTADDRYVFLAHLRQGTVLVRVGEPVVAGEPIGRIGNSGNSSWPHLHLHVQDRPEMDDPLAVGLPHRMRSVERKRWLFWRELTAAALVRNDRIRVPG